MTSYAPRDPKTDRLLAPENCVFAIIDYQPTQIESIESMNRYQLVQNIVATTKLMQAYHVPIILSTVNVGTGRNKDTITALKDLLGDTPSYDRTTINAWEDKEFNEAITSTNRHNIIMAALWTEACLTFPAIDALAEGYDVYPVVDAVGGTSLTAHNAALRRVEQAGAKLTSYAQLACELQRDWNRTETVPAFLENMSETGKFLIL
ncbi:isochorismatase family protein [Lactobacillus sp. LC28-10]|uniref:Isochorismatase family protein n=1 Tax=Secundilactobacillus angelensis TaxID=2722706 RepID=A0ABX1KVB1_9LACO|nr:isochorismatase family protein [Secundilactobacillus angelensis]MCH5461567.1 isochorismatase family protein [Secundilactobacillus angelensis]NLR17862.1 isochorismatase family protein [Secundilactobacillus angelensis]